MFARLMTVLSVITVLMMGCSISENSSDKQQRALVKGGTALLGRTQEEVNEDFKQCVAMAERTSQDSELTCGSKEVVFGDVPERRVEVSSFSINVYEYADDDFLPKEVSLAEARSICESEGGRLPTGAEWEYAARGSEGSIWPWGNEYISGYSNIDEEGGNPSNPRRRIGELKSARDLFDIIGNACEWVSEGFCKGGSSGSYIPYAKPSHRITDTQRAGFRCVFD